MTEPHRRRLPRELAGLATLALAAIVVLCLGALVDRMPFAADRAIMTGLRAWGGPPWLPQVAVNLTALGGGTVLTLVVALVAGFLLVQRLWLTATMLLLATASGGYAVDLVKQFVGRARPTLVDHLVPVSSASFPSGHAASSAVVYLTLAALAAQVVRQRRARRYLFAAAVFLTGAVGSSRVYLGVHWPSDVLAGWSFGTLWALGWWWATAFTRAAIGGERG
ncbi:phosphatase PAP2 family protein [Sphingomonas sp. KR1UV-12]|uniref:Phosphatase PAP2 family protein n=1 Tax=Sphingomonas aurea TaxID=3063994 RepID=A0ABT9EMH6_9SPHN|nr:phosphatase PAP2 family protein [Sphingomonas sp. KR1UV-12]MDP1028151.1 phosphatase PAP2 family protein [Sphingomonas sp. KR1UV-12]